MCRNYRVFSESYSLMDQTHTPNLIEVLRATVENVERTCGVRSGDPSLLQLKTIRNRRVAELERTMAFEFVKAASEPLNEQGCEQLEWEMAS